MGGRHVFVNRPTFSITMGPKKDKGSRKRNLQGEIGLHHVVEGTRERAPVQRLVDNPTLDDKQLRAQQRQQASGSKSHASGSDAIIASLSGGRKFAEEAGIISRNSGKEATGPSKRAGEMQVSEPRMKRTRKIDANSSSRNPWLWIPQAIVSLGERAQEAVQTLDRRFQHTKLALELAMDSMMGVERVEDEMDVGSDSEPDSADEKTHLQHPLAAADDISGSGSDDENPNLSADENFMTDANLKILEDKIAALEGMSKYYTLDDNQRRDLEMFKFGYEMGKKSQKDIVPDYVHDERGHRVPNPALREKTTKEDWDKNGPLNNPMIRTKHGPKPSKKQSKNTDKNLPASRNLGNKKGGSPPPRFKNPYAVTRRFKPTMGPRDAPCESTHIGHYAPLTKHSNRDWVLTVSASDGTWDNQPDLTLVCHDSSTQWYMVEKDGVGDCWQCTAETLEFTVEDITTIMVDADDKIQITQEQIDQMKARLKSVGIEVTGGTMPKAEESKDPMDEPHLELRIPVPRSGVYVKYYHDEAEEDDIDRMTLVVSEEIDSVVWIREKNDDEDGSTKHDSDSGYQSSVYSQEAAADRMSGSEDGDRADDEAWDGSDSEYEFADCDDPIPGTDTMINQNGYDVLGNFHMGALGWFNPPANGAAAQGGNAAQGNAHPQGNGDEVPGGPSAE